MNTSNASSRFATLDGWRGISILCVLAAHLLPLGPQAWQLNATAALLALAHLSTFHFEHRWIAFGRRLSGRMRANALAARSS